MGLEARPGRPARRRVWPAVSGVGGRANPGNFLSWLGCPRASEKITSPSRRVDQGELGSPQGAGWRSLPRDQASPAPFGRSRPHLQAPELLRVSISLSLMFERDLAFLLSYHDRAVVRKRKTRSVAKDVALPVQPKRENTSADRHDPLTSRSVRETRRGKPPAVSPRSRDRRRGRTPRHRPFRFSIYRQDREGDIRSSNAERALSRRHARPVRYRACRPA